MQFGKFPYAIQKPYMRLKNKKNLFYAKFKILKIQ